MLLAGENEDPAQDRAEIAFSDKGGGLNEFEGEFSRSLSITRPSIRPLKVISHTWLRSWGWRKGHAYSPT